MDLRDFSNKLAEATKGLTPEERASLKKIFEGVSQEISKAAPTSTVAAAPVGTGIPEGPARTCCS